MFGEDISKDLVIATGTFEGWTVNQLLAEANKAIGGCGSSYSFAQLNEALDAFNSNYDDGKANNQFLNCPVCAFITNGTASQTGGAQCYQLTPAVFHKAGSVFSNTPIDLTKSFEINATMNFGSNNAGGDGIAFVLQSEGPNYLGNYGAGIGYHRFDGIFGCAPADNPGPVNSFIVEFDTYQNGIINCENIGDPKADHIGFMSHSNAYHTSQYALSAPKGFGANIEDGQDHDVKFTWNATTKTMTVVFTVSAGVVKTYKYKGDIVTKLFGGNPNVYFGFTASTGSHKPNVQTVCIKSPCAPQDETQETSVASSASVKQLNLKKSITINVYPNPNSGRFTVNFSSISGKGNISIINATVQYLKAEVLQQMQMGNQSILT